MRKGKEESGMLDDKGLCRRCKAIMPNLKNTPNEYALHETGRVNVWDEDNENVGEESKK